MKEGSRANSLLVELLLVIFFFMLGATTLVELFAAYAEVEADMAFLPIWDVVLPASFGSGEYYASTSELLIGAITPEEMAQRLQDAWIEAQE